MTEKAFGFSNKSEPEGVFEDSKRRAFANDLDENHTETTIAIYSREGRWEDKWRFRIGAQRCLLSPVEPQG